MSLPSVFQTIRLAIGPSLTYTTGALNVGKYFREVLLGVPFHPDNRIIVELLGNYAISGKEFGSGMAVIAGLGGYLPGETRMPVSRFQQIIRTQGGFQLMTKTWPFNESSDLVYNRKSQDLPHPNTIRFHVLSDNNQIILQAEYTVAGNGIVFGPGSRDIDTRNNLQSVDSFQSLLNICKEQNISLSDYIYSSEELIHSVAPDQSKERMIRTWEIMEYSIKNGLENSKQQLQASNRISHHLITQFKERSTEQALIGHEFGLAAIYAAAICEESISSQLVMTSPSCETAGVLPACLKTIKSKFRLDSQSIADSLMVAGYVGSLLSNQIADDHIVSHQKHDFRIATAMAAASAVYALSDNIDRVDSVIKLAMRLTEDQGSHTIHDLVFNNMKFANLALTSVNLAMLDYPAH